MALVADETKVNQVLKPKNMLRPMVLLFVAYLVLAYGSQLLMIPGMNLISICFPVGLCFAALQSYGWRVLPVLIIGNLCSAFLLDNQSLLICAAGTLAAVCAKSCLSHMNPHIIKLEQAKHIF